MPPFLLFNLQFVFALAAYALFAGKIVAPRLAALPRDQALAPLLWVHVFRFIGGTILAPGAVDATVPADFRLMVGLGDMLTALLALIAIAALYLRASIAIPLVWLMLVVATLDTANAVVQSLRDNVFGAALGLNW